MTFHADRLSAPRTLATAALTPPAGHGHRLGPVLFVLGSALAVGTAALVWSAAAHAQTAPPKPAAPAVTTAQASEPKYTVAQIAQAFSFIDGNRDGQISREEAAGFRGVARHFDEADTNKDGSLSREEFESALNGEKGR